VAEAAAPEAPAFSVVADVAIVKGDTPAGDRTWLSFPDGTARREAIHVINDLPHLVVESVFSLDEARWGTLAARQYRGLRLVTDASAGDPGWPGDMVAKAAVSAVVNRWGDGPDTPSGIRSRLRGAGRGRAADRRAAQGGGRRGTAALPRLGRAAGRRHAARHLAAA
jgi:hypothetical protein